MYVPVCTMTNKGFFFLLSSSVFRTMGFWNNGILEQLVFVFEITGCRSNGLSVQWCIFSDYWVVGITDCRNNGQSQPLRHIPDI